MPLTWTIDPQQKLVTAIAKGDVTRAEFDALLDTLRDADAHGYRKLFDGGRGETRITPEKVLAVVLPEKYAELAAHVLGMLAAADRPMRVFDKSAPARRWIRSLAGPGNP